MNYTKPEVALLGQAVRVIELVIPHKPVGPIVDGPFGLNPAYDLDE